MFDRPRARPWGAATLAVAALALTAPAASADTATQTFTGTVSPTAKTKTHVVNVTAPGTITVSLDWTTTSANLDAFLKAPAPATGDAAKAVSTTARPETITFNATATGKWQVRVRATTGSSAYTATVTYQVPASGGGGGAATFHRAYGFSGSAGLYAYGMDFDPTDDTILVGDYWNYRVYRYTKSGQRVGGAVSRPAPGGQSGGALAPYDVEADVLDRNGAGLASLWVADQGSSRIVQFDHNGNWMRTIGKLSDGQAPGAGGRAYAQGCGAGKMEIPTHILVDAATERIHVSDPRCRQVYTFDHATGAYLGQFDWTGFSADTGIGVPIPRGIAKGADGRIYVVEFNSRQIAVFSAAGTYLGYSSAKIPSVAGDTMNDPRGLDVSPDGGFVYVVGAFYNKVYQFRTSAAGAPLYVKRWRNLAGNDLKTDPSQKFDAIRFPAVDDDGNVYVGETWGSDSYGYGVVKFNPNGSSTPAAHMWTTAPQAPPRGGYNQQNGIAINPNDSEAAGDALFVVDTFEQRVQKFDTASTCASEGSCPAWIRQWGSREPAAPTSQGFGYPRALTFGADGLVWVGDNNNAVLAFQPDGTFVKRFGSQGKGAGQFSGGVQGLRVTATRIYATDVAGCRLQVFDRAKVMQAGVTSIANAPAGTLIAAMGTCGTGANQMTAPRGVAVDPADPDIVYVAETGTNRISRWNVTTKTATQVKPSCAGKGLAQPWGITEHGGWYYIGDVKNARVVRWNPAGNACEVVVTAADVPAGMQFLGSNFVEFDSAGRMYVSDNSRRVYAFTLTS